jgi:hypothetical protein
MRLKKNITAQVTKTVLGAVLFLSTASILKSQDLTSSLTNSLLYQTDFHTSSTGYTYTTNGNGMGPMVYVTNRSGVPTQWATGASGQDGWVSSAQGGNSAYGPGANVYAGSYTIPYFQSFGGDTYYSTDIDKIQTYPQSATNYLTQSQYAGTGINKIHFDTTFSIYGDPTSPNANGNYDTLGWTLLNSSGKALIGINLNTGTDPTAGWTLTTTTYANNGVANQVFTKNNSTALSPLDNGKTTHLGFNIVGIGTAQQSIQILDYGTNYSSGGTNYSVLGTDLIAGYDFSGIAGGTTIAALASTWILNDTDPSTILAKTGTNADGSTFTYNAYSDYAFNSLQMNNLTVSVPEPKTWVLFGISALIMVVALRRKTS